MKLITIEDYLMGRIKFEDLSPELQSNLQTLLPKVNELLAHFGEYRKVSSGYRSPEYNATIKNAAKKSNHTLCLACDLYDPDGKLDAFCSDNLVLLEQLGLYLESPSATPNWCHVQAVAPASKRRIFFP